MSTPLRQLLTDILFDDAARNDFGADSQAFLQEHGWSTLEGTELQEAVAALGDGLPVETAQAIESAVQNVDFSHGSLGEIGAELADAVSEIELEYSAETERGDTENELDFGTGAESETSPEDQQEPEGTAGLDGHEELGSETATHQVVLEDGTEGIDIDEPLVHDIDDIDAVEIEFDPDEPGIDDLEI